MCGQNLGKSLVGKGFWLERFLPENCGATINKHCPFAPVPPIFPDCSPFPPIFLISRHFSL